MNRTYQILATWLICVCVPAISYSQSSDHDFSAISGFTEPYRSIEVAAAETGTISQIEVVEGQTIESGEILARLNEDVHAASLGMAEEKIGGKGRLNSAVAELKMQQERFQKLLGLFQRGNASRIEVDRAKTQLDIATANVEAVQDDGRIAVYEHKRALAQLELRRLRSPIDGVVTRIHKDPGEFVSPNDPVVLSIVQLNPLKAIFPVPQRKARQLSSGQQIDVQVGRDRVLASGVVEFVSPTTDAQSGTCRVTIKIDNSDGQLQSGDTCVLPGSELSDSGERHAGLDGPQSDHDFHLVNVGQDNE